MADVKSIIQKRFKASQEKSSKMSDLAQRSSSGNLSTFSGVFKVGSLTEKEEASLESILTNYKSDEQLIEMDLEELSIITSEVKAINNQAIILHGERIQKAQTIFKKYKDGAFSAWLISTYGNRQTPYNFLLYFEFYSSMTNSLQKQIDVMPRQAIYTLASRNGPLEKKKELIEKYEGETKQELLEVIRELFPLSDNDLRKEQLPEYAIKTLTHLVNKLNKNSFKPSLEDCQTINSLLDQIRLLTLRR
jgi:hypothetical protein